MNSGCYSISAPVSCTSTPVPKIVCCLLFGLDGSSFNVKNKQSICPSGSGVELFPSKKTLRRIDMQ